MQPLLNRVRKRLVLRTFVRVAAACVVGLAGVVAVLALLRWLAVPLPGWVISANAIGFALLVALVGSGIVAWRRAPSLVQAARAVERQAGLAERLSTSLELGQRTDPLARALRRDAQARAEQINARRVVPIAVGAPLGGWLVASVVVASAALLLAAHPLALRAAPAPSAALGVEGSGTPSANGFIQQLLDTSAQAPAVTSPVARRNALPDSALQGAPAQVATTERPQAAAGQPTIGASAASVGQAEGGATAAQLVDRVSQSAEVLPAVQPQSQANAASSPPAEISAADPRNAGTTNPNYNQAAARDQELREHARRRQAGSSPGGGDGDQVAMADAAVAGSATAGFDGEGGVQPLLPPPAGPSNDLTLPDITDSSGRRVTLERLPDMVMQVQPDWLPGTADWAPGHEPAVYHDVALQGELEFLGRYNTPEYGQAP